MWWLCISSALAWGPSAHREIGARAEVALEPAARVALAELTDRSLADLSTELDTLRARPDWRWSRPLHYVHADPRGEALVVDCPDHRCVPDAVLHFAHRLARHPDPAARREALMVVVHLVGDLHQPLHVGFAADRGGNDHPVWHGGAQTDLHTLWDDVVPALPGGMVPVALASDAAEGTPRDWAAATFALTREEVYAVPPGAVVGAAYLDRARALSARQISLAGVRLGRLLNQALQGVPPAEPDPLVGETYRRGSALGDSSAGRAALVVGVVLLAVGLAVLAWRSRPGPGWRAVREVARHRGAALWALLAVLLTVSVDVVAPVALKYGLDTVIPEPTPAAMATLAAMLLGSLALAALGWVLAASALSRFVSRVQRDLRLRMVARLQGASLPAVRRRSVADVLSRFLGDLQQFDTFLLRDLPRIVRSSVQTVGLVAVMVGIEWRLTLGTLLLLPPMVWLPKRLARRARLARHARQEAEAHAGGVVHELVASLPMLRAFDLEARWARRYEARAAAIDEAARRQGWLSVMIPGAGFTSGQALMVLVLLGSAGLAARGEVSVGDVSALFGALFVLAAALTRLATAVPAAVNALGAWERVAEVLDLPQLSGVSGPVEPLRHGIRLEGVVFSHDGQRNHLDGVDLHIPAGRSTAVVGPSGAGKSTLVWLLLHHAEADGGRVVWDGRPLHGGHRAAIGLVPQQSPMFAMSVRDNIRLGRLDASDLEVEAAAREAAIHTAIEALPEGYDTVLGPEGVQLSGGQCQRLAIARALLRRPSLWVLDEATSALDPSTAATVRRTLERVGAGCTTLTISHDLAAVQDHDHIIVLDEGRVAGQGSHASLLAQCPLYRELVEQQRGLVVLEGGRRARVDPARLARVPLLSSLPSALRARLAEQMATEQVEAGETLVRWGDPADRAFVIVRGSLAVEVAGQGEVRRCGPGALVGEIALLYDRPRSATLRAHGHCVVLSLARADFLELLGAEPGLERRVRSIAAARWAHTAGPPGEGAAEGPPRGGGAALRTATGRPLRGR